MMQFPCARSQTLNTRGCTPSKGIVRTLTPGMICWERRRKGWLCGQERVALQGMCVADLAGPNSDVKHSRLAALAGDMYNLISYSQVKIAGLAALEFPAMNK